MLSKVRSGDEALLRPVRLLAAEQVLLGHAAVVEDELRGLHVLRDGPQALHLAHAGSERALRELRAAGPDLLNTRSLLRSGADLSYESTVARRVRARGHCRGGSAPPGQAEDLRFV